ncbi:MAG: ABC-2 type transport system ATP-binding protein [Sphingobacteriales bacterium]|jgi:ABC-2 type transport system ATP-binding protein
MSVVVKNLTKVYGTQNAVDNVSFSAEPGKILGFLGPNGAGKSTTMKIITCFIPQTAGSVTVCGHDVVSDSMAVRSKVGYLPEHNPLYLDMYVKEYLHFIADLHDLGKNAKDRVTEMIELTGLGKEQNKKIEALSKGYRQRVGLAQAMLHDPEVLILDEPTTGLDPNQLKEIRALIKKIGQEKTVILSTHIMQEVEAICDKVLIINNGKIVANDDTANLRSLGGRKIFLVEFSKQVDASKLFALNGINKVSHLEGGKYRLEAEMNVDAREAVFKFAVAEEVTLLSSEQKEESLEDVFRKLTQNN